MTVVNSPQRGVYRSSRRFTGTVLGMIGGLCVCGIAWAYPEFEMYVEENTPRHVNCAMCHTHPDGPEGNKPGQMGAGLNADELHRLNEARAAFEPGHEVDSPILNEFGNHILEKLGKREFLLLRQSPGKLADALGNESDLDGDGIPDAQEYLAGTHPVDAQSGNPWKLLMNNLQKSWFHVVMITLATVAGLFGLNNLLHWFAQTSKRNQVEEIEEWEKRVI